MAGHQNVPASPTALRLRRPGWRDPRLLLGIVLVAASVALGSAVVSAAGRTVPVYVAADAMVPGDPVETGSMRVRDVRFADAAEAYLRADEPLPDGLVVTRTVGAGELVPRAAIAREADLGLRPVAIEPDGAMPGGLAAGSLVDLWYVPEASRGSATSTVADTGDGASVTGALRGAAEPPGEATPGLLVGGLTVSEVSEPRPGLATGSSVTVHVLVPVDDLATVLAALAADGSVEVVLVPGAGA